MAPSDNSNDKDPLAGTKYRTISLIGRGGMGEVFLADHLELGKTVVVKLLHPKYASREALVDRMRVEAQALGALSHENIVSVTDAGRTPGGRPFIVMERLNGCTLHEELATRGRIPLHTALIYMRGVLAGLSAAHAIGVVHRDVKSANIFLHVDADGRCVSKLLDFGVVKVLEGGVQKGLKPPAYATEEGMVVGTPGYVSPEQAMHRGVDPRSDLYAAGVVLYQLIAGRGPFDEHGKGEKLIAAHVRETPPAPSQFCPEPVPPELDAIVLKTLEKDPARRFQSAVELERELGALLDGWRKPVGWVPTTAFDGREFLGPPPKDLRLPQPKFVDERSREQWEDGKVEATTTAVSPTNRSSHEPSGAAPQREPRAAETHSEPAPEMRRMAAIFVLIALATAVGAAVLIAWAIAR